MCPSYTCSTTRGAHSSCILSVLKEMTGNADPLLPGIIDDALMRRMEVIGEAARRVPEELRSRYPSIDWPRIVGLRNRLIHEYDTVDLPLLRRIVINELPPLIAQLERILADRDA